MMGTNRILRAAAFLLAVGVGAGTISLTQADSAPPSKPDAAQMEKVRKLIQQLGDNQDKASYNEFNDYGHYPATDYAGYTGIPEGYWVYVYPNWYIWGELKKK